MSFEHKKGTSLIVREPIGVVGLITPWNWPLNQITCKVGPAIAAGCTMILKPSRNRPAQCHDLRRDHARGGRAGRRVQSGQWRWPRCRRSHVAHPGIDMMSFTGSTRAGIMVAKAAADTVKRVSQELGGKSANILLPDVDLKVAVSKGVGEVLQQQRPVLQCTHPHAGAARSRWRRGWNCQGARPRSCRSDPARRARQASGPGGERSAVQQDPGPDRERHQGRAPSW